MKLKINRYGYLEIKRGPKWKRQECPFSVVGDVGTQQKLFCGDWCPLFTEPCEEDNIPPGTRALYLCGAIHVGEITDKRE